MHLDEEQVQRLRHGELGAAPALSARTHLAECTACRERAAALDREERAVLELLRAVDHVPPRVSAESVVARARARTPARGGSSLRWAAGILLALGLAGVAYAAPGSPIRAWVRCALRAAPCATSQQPQGARDSASGVPLTPSRGAAGSAAGIALAPGRELVITFTSPQATGGATVSLTDGAEVVVRAPAGAATFTSDVDRLVIDNEGSAATFEIQIPRAAPRVEIRVRGQRVFLKDGASVTTQTPAEQGGSYPLSLRAPGS